MNNHDYLNNLKGLGLLYIDNGNYELKITDCKFKERTDKSTNLLILELKVLSGISKYQDGTEEDASDFRFTVFQNLPKEQTESNRRQCMAVTYFLRDLGINKVSEYKSLINKEFTADVIKKDFDSGRYYSLQNIELN